VEDVDEDVHNGEEEEGEGGSGQNEGEGPQVFVHWDPSVVLKDST